MIKEYNIESEDLNLLLEAVQESSDLIDIFNKQFQKDFKFSFTIEEVENSWKCNIKINKNEIGENT